MHLDPRSLDVALLPDGRDPGRGRAGWHCIPVSTQDYLHLLLGMEQHKDRSGQQRTEYLPYQAFSACLTLESEWGKIHPYPART